MTIDETTYGGNRAGDPDTKVYVPRVSSTSESSLEDPRGEVKTIECTFGSTDDPRYSKPIPEYEGAHRWDPEFDWTEEEEKAIVRKVCCKTYVKMSWN